MLVIPEEEVVVVVGMYLLAMGEEAEGHLLDHGIPIEIENEDTTAIDRAEIETTAPQMTEVPKENEAGTTADPILHESKLGIKTNLLMLVAMYYHG